MYFQTISQSRALNVLKMPTNPAEFINNFNFLYLTVANTNSIAKLFYIWSYSKKTTVVGTIMITAYIKQSSVAEYAEQRVDVTFTGKVETCAYMTTRRHHTPGISEEEIIQKLIYQKDHHKVTIINKNACHHACVWVCFCFNYYTNSGCSLLTASSSWVLCRSNWIFFSRGTQ